MSNANGRRLADELRRQSAVLGAMASPLERASLEVGMGLTEALPGLHELKTLFETLAQSLESAAIGAAIDDLNRIAAELARAADGISDESRALVELADLNQSIGGRICELLTCMRTISSLVFSMKIEAAPLDDGREGLTAFAQGVQELSDRGRRALDEYQSAYGNLDALLTSSCEAQTAFQRSHQAGLRAIAGDIRESLGAVADLRRRTLTALRDIGALSREVGERIGQCLVALQVGDSARQRVEHVQAALDLSIGQLDQPPADRPEAIVARLCRLQARQLDDTAAEFGREYAAVCESLKELTRENDTLARRGREVFGAADLDDSSFLETVERKLAAARTIVAECRTARAVVDRATASVAATMTDLQQRTQGLSEIVGDVTIIGTNALLRSTRLGDRGKGFTVIAQELRAYSRLIAEAIDALPPKLDDVAACAARVGEVGRNLDAERLGGLDARMSGAIEAFDSNGKQMTAALERLRREAESVRGALDQALATLAEHDGITGVLGEGAEALDAIAGRLGGAEGRAPTVDRLLDEWLRPTYSMSSERRVHDAYTGRAAEEEVLSDAAADDLAAVLF